MQTVGPTDPGRDVSAEREQKMAALNYVQEAWAEARLDGIDDDCMAMTCLFAAFAELVGVYGEEAAAKYAKENGAGPSIAIVDDGGNLLYFTRPETSFAAGANVSIGKARTSAIFKKRTSFFEDTINQGRFTMTALPDFTPLQGGVPIMHDGQVIGAAGTGLMQDFNVILLPSYQCEPRRSLRNLQAPLA